jgi:hypothetical protein
MPFVFYSGGIILFVLCHGITKKVSDTNLFHGIKIRNIKKLVLGGNFDCIKYLMQ